MDETNIIKQEESIKFSKGMTGKFSYEIKLLGKPEDNLQRVKELISECDNITTERGAD